MENIRTSASIMEEIVKVSHEQAIAVGQLNANMTDIRSSIDATGLSAERIISESEKLEIGNREMSDVIKKLNA